MLDDFEDSSFWTPDTTVGWWDIDGTTVYRHTQSLDPSHGGFGAMRVDYTKSNLPWSLFGAFISDTNPLRNFRGKTRLTVWVRGNATLLVKLRDRQLREAEIGRQTATNPGGWNKLVFDYGEAPIELSDVDNIMFFVEPGDPAAAGTIFLDDLSLE